MSNYSQLFLWPKSLRNTNKSLIYLVRLSLYGKSDIETDQGKLNWHSNSYFKILSFEDKRFFESPRRATSLKLRFQGKQFFFKFFFVLFLKFFV